MKKEKKNVSEHDDGTYVVKRSRRSSIMAFIVCLLVAVVIWAYAEASEKQKMQQIADIVDTAEINAVVTQNEG